MERDPPVLRERSWAAFRSRDFRRLWISNLSQFLATQLQRIAIQWLVTELTSSRALLGLVGFAQGVMVVLASPVAGVAVDRLPKRRLLIGGRVGLAAALAVLALLVWAGRVEIWHVLALSVATGGILALVQPASQTYVYDVVGRERVQNAIALNVTGTGLAEMGGPALAGILIAAAGLVATLGAGVAGMLAGAALLLWIPVRGLATAPRDRSALRDLREGFRYVASHPPVLLALLICTLAFFNGAILAMRPVFARHVLDVGSAGFGAMAAAAGAGTVCGAFLATLLPRLRRPGLVMAWSMLGYSICLVLYSLAFSLAYVIAVEFALGIASQVWNVATFAGLQMAVPEAMRGRVVGMVFMAVQLAALGQLAVGALADTVGDQTALAAFGGIPILVLSLVLVFGHARLREL